MTHRAQGRFSRLWARLPPGCVPAWTGAAARREEGRGCHAHGMGVGAPCQSAGACMVHTPWIGYIFSARSAEGLGSNLCGAGLGQAWFGIRAAAGRWRWGGGAPGGGSFFAERKKESKKKKTAKIFGDARAFFSSRCEQIPRRKPGVSLCRGRGIRKRYCETPAPEPSASLTPKIRLVRRAKLGRFRSA